MIYVSCFVQVYLWTSRRVPRFIGWHIHHNSTSRSACFLLAFSGCIFGSSGGVSASGGGGLLPSPAAASGFTVARYGNHKSWVFRHVSVRIIRIHICVGSYILYVYKGDARRKKKYSKFLLLSLLAFYLIFFRSSDPIHRAHTAAVKIYIYIYIKKNENEIQV